MSRPAVIGIAGPARAGKDSVAQLLVAASGGYVYPFATGLKAMLNAGLGIDLTQPYWEQRKDEMIPVLGKSPRQLMQTLGTEWGRKMVHDDLWVIMAHERLLANGPGMICSDVRMENEAEFVRKFGRMIHVRRTKAPKVSEHSSENGVAICDEDIVIVNDGTLEDLRALVKESIAEAWGLSVV